MSLSPQTLRRLPTIKKELLLGSNYDTIAEKLGVGHRTIDRDIKHWLESGEFETWIKEEWLRLHNIIIHENPTEAYRNITKLVGKMLTQRLEASTTHTERIFKVELSAKLLSNETCLSNPESQSIMNPMQNKKNSTKDAIATVTEQPSQE